MNSRRLQTKTEMAAVCSLFFYPPSRDTKAVTQEADPSQPPRSQVDEGAKRCGISDRDMGALSWSLVECYELIHRKKGGAFLANRCRTPKTVNRICRRNTADALCTFKEK